MDQAEQLRKIMQNAEKPKARVITVTSGKGGVGKTSLSLNLAICLERLGKKVIILDADFGLANIEVMLGVHPQYNLSDMMFHGKELTDIITKGAEGIGFISGGSGIQEVLVMNREQIMYLTSRLVELDEVADYILVDTGAGISDSVLEFVIASSEILLVVTPEPTSITDAYALLKTLKRKEEFSKEETCIKIIANRVKNEEEGRSLFKKMSVVSEKFLDVPLHYMGFIPMDDEIPKAVIRQRPVTVMSPEAAASKAINQIARQLLELEPEEIRESRGGISEFFSNMIRNKMLKR